MHAATMEYSQSTEKKKTQAIRLSFFSLFLFLAYADVWWIHVWPAPKGKLFVPHAPTRHKKKKKTRDRAVVGCQTRQQRRVADTDPDPPLFSLPHPPLQTCRRWSSHRARPARWGRSRSTVASWRFERIATAST
jgi:hypothetical protein